MTPETDLNKEKQTEFELDLQSKPEVGVQTLASINQLHADLGNARVSRAAEKGEISATTLQSKKPATDTSRGWLQAQIFFELHQGPKGFAVDRWAILTAKPVDGLTPEERKALDSVIQRALFESYTGYSAVFAGTMPARLAQIELTCPLTDLSDERSQGLLAFKVCDQLRAKIESTRNVEIERRKQLRERLRYEPAPGRTLEQELSRETATLREEIARMRREMQIGYNEQVTLHAVGTNIGAFAAFAATSPEPDLGGWNRPEEYLRQAEQSLLSEDPRGANMFMDVARVTFKSQQDWWGRYKHSYNFGDEVIGPVFWQAFSLLSLGIVDKELFELSAKASKVGVGHQLLVVAETVVERVANLLSFGAYEGWKQGVERRIDKAPDDPLWYAMLAAGPDAVQGVIDTMLPFNEIKTMAGVPTKDETGRTVNPDFWARVGAFFSALLKVAVLGGIAKGKFKGKAAEKVGAPEGYGDRTAGSKQEAAPTPESQAALEKMRYGEFTPEDLGAERKPGAAPEKPAKSPPPEREKGPREKEGPTPTTIPDTHPHVTLIGVTLEQFYALLAELKKSTAMGREVARRIDSGEFEVTVANEPFTKNISGAAMPKEVYIEWKPSLEETASTAIHEVVHQADPMLSKGSRSQVEANARVSEYEYRSSKGLPPYDFAEDVYRAVLEKAKKEGTDQATALDQARKAMIDAMRTDPERYGIEKDPEGQTKGPAKAPTKSTSEKAEPAKEKSEKEKKSKSKKQLLLEEKEQAIPADLLAKLKAMNLAEYLRRQLIMHGPEWVRKYVEGSKAERDKIRKLMALREHAEKQMAKDKAPGPVKDYFEENIPTRDPTFEDLSKDPSPAEIIAGAEKPQGTFEKNEARTIGQVEERAEIRERMPELKAEGYKEVHLRPFKEIPWLNKIFPGNSCPDFVAVDRVGKRILIGDPTTRLVKEHFEKTKMYGNHLLDWIKTMPEFKGFEVWIIDYARTSWRQMEPHFIGKAE